MRKYTINKFLSLKLEDGVTWIYVNRKRFLQCKRQERIPPQQEFSEHCSNLKRWTDKEYDLVFGYK